MKIALVHDALVNFGGAERVLSVFHEIFSEAPIYTTVYLPECTHSSLSGADIRTSFLQKLVHSEQALKLVFPLTFLAMRRLDFAGYDVVLSSSTFCAKDLNTPPGTRHICYCYSFFRPAWEFSHYMSKYDMNPLAKSALAPLFAFFRRWDYNAAQKPHLLITISQHAARKIERAYGRKPAIIYPPVDVARYPLSEKSEDFFLVVSRLMPYKRIDVVVEAFNQVRAPLKIVGVGPDLRRLRALARANVEFVGPVSEETLIEYYARCRCVIFPGEEDFGLVPLEAHACGKPAIALGRGGALETVIGFNDRNATSGSSYEATGVFFYEQTPEALADAVGLFEKLTFHPQAIRRRAWLFDKSHFKKKILGLIECPPSAEMGAVSEPDEATL